MTLSRAFVVVISGPSGAGKSTLAAAAAERLGDAVRIESDDYDADRRHPDDVAAWITEGADPNAFSWPTFAVDQRALRDGQPVTQPNGKVLAPVRFVLAIEPFGRARRELAGLIDFVVRIDLPLEIALARRVHRTVGYALRGGGDPTRVLKMMDWYLDLYLHRGVRDMYAAAEAHARGDCDLVLDGTREPAALAEQLAEAVARCIDR